VLAVSDDKLDVRSCRRKLPRENAHARGGPGKSRGWVWVQPRIPRPARAMKFNNPTFYGYIRVVLIKTNLMIYMLYKILGECIDMCSLSKTMSSTWETTRRVGGCQRLWESCGWCEVVVPTRHGEPAPGVRVSRQLGISRGGTCHEIFNSYLLWLYSSSTH